MVHGRTQGDMEKTTTVTTTHYPDGSLVMEIITTSLPVIPAPGGEVSAPVPTHKG